MEINKVYHLNFLENTLPNNCANLIIADPPYFEVKGEFDFIWKSFEDYLKDVEKWAIECKRLLKENGTLIYYGDSKKIAYSQIIFDKYFGLISNVTIHIFDRQTNKIKIEDARGFINTTERFLMYSNDVYNLTQCVFNIRDYIRAEILRAKGKIVFKDINKALGVAFNGGGVASACLSLEKSEPSMLTKEMYEKLRKWLNDGQEYEYLRQEYEDLRQEYEYLRQEYEDLRQEYEDLRQEYEDLRRPFNPIEEFKMDVLRFSQEGHNTGKYDHPTVKPEKLTRYLIQTCSRENDLVVVPFAGSGTECAMALKEKRNFIGFEIEEKHVNTSNKRIELIKSKPQLF